jgi:hypothetical protein
MKKNYETLSVQYIIVVEIDTDWVNFYNTPLGATTNSITTLNIMTPRKMTIMLHHSAKWHLENDTRHCNI